MKKRIMPEAPPDHTLRIDDQLPEAPPDHVLRIDDQTWQGLEKNLGCSLEKWARDEITAATDQFVVAQYFRIVDKARRQLRGSRSKPTNISRLRGHLVHVLEEWSDIQNDPTAQRFFEDVANEIGLGDVDDIMWRLWHLNVCLDAYFDPPKHDPFNRYVKKISEVYENKKVMGKPAPKTVPAYDNQKPSKFVMVMMALNRILPDYAQKNYRLPGAWAQALNRARKS